MNRVYLQRLESTDHGTFGKLIVDNQWFYTGELPWRLNSPFVSCIPAGFYECKWSYSARFQRFCYEVEDVPHRDGIRFHSANLMGDKTVGLVSQVEGCIALGTFMGFLKGQRAVLGSRQAMDRFERYMAEEPFLLEIED